MTRPRPGRGGVELAVDDAQREPVVVARNHVRVLRAIQNQTVVAEQLQQYGRQEEAGGRMLTVDWHTRLDIRLQHRDALTAAAVAGGVPRAWVDHVTERGRRGVRWRRDLYLREPEPVGRGRLLAAVRADVLRTREMTAVAATYGDWGATAEPGTASLFTRNLKALWRRSAAVSHLLDLTDAETDKLWGTTDSWIRAAADSAAREATLESRWRQAARLDTKGYARQAAALAAVGIPTDPAGHTLPPLPELLDHLRDALATPSALPGPDREASRGRGVVTAAAVEAAGLDGTLGAEITGGGTDPPPASPHSAADPGRDTEP